MGLIYLSFKSEVMAVLNNIFPRELVDRFTLRMDSEIFIAKEDEFVWRQKKNGTESCHVLFDGIEIFEVPGKLDRKRAEWWILMSFRDAIKSGKLSIEQKPEFTDNATIRRNKKKIAEAKKAAIADSYQFAVQNPMSHEQFIKRFGDKQKTVYKLKGGSNGKT